MFFGRLGENYKGDKPVSNLALLIVIRKHLREIGANFKEHSMGLFTKGVISDAERLEFFRKTEEWVELSDFLYKMFEIQDEDPLL